MAVVANLVKNRSSPPNQSLEPMARAVTRPAGAGRAPALAMAHH